MIRNFKKLVPILGNFRLLRQQQLKYVSLSNCNVYNFAKQKKQEGESRNEARNEARDETRNESQNQPRNFSQEYQEGETIGQQQDTKGFPRYGAQKIDQGREQRSQFGQTNRDEMRQKEDESDDQFFNRKLGGDRGEDRQFGGQADKDWQRRDEGQRNRAESQNWKENITRQEQQREGQQGRDQAQRDRAESQNWSENRTRQQQQREGQRNRQGWKENIAREDQAQQNQQSEGQHFGKESNKDFNEGWSQQQRQQEQQQQNQQREDQRGERQQMEGRERNDQEFQRNQQQRERQDWNRDESQRQSRDEAQSANRDQWSERERSEKKERYERADAERQEKQESNQPQRDQESRQTERRDREQQPGFAYYESLEMISVDTNDDWEGLKENEKPVILDFYKTGCNVCKRIYPRLVEKAKANEGRWLLAGANFDSDLVRQFAKDLNVADAPTVMLVFRGKIVDQVKGDNEGNLNKMCEKANELSKE